MTQQTKTQAKPNLCIHESLDLIGNTPIKKLNAINTSNCNIWVKLEYLQPGGSVKDRAAKAIVLHAKKAGLLKEGQTVVEMTSGNMGAGLAVVCGMLGHPFIATMSCGNSIERVRMLKGLGAEVVLVDQVTGTYGKVTGEDIEAAKQKAIQISNEQNAFFINQFYAEQGLNAHRYGTAVEIADALSYQVDAFVAIVGSAGTLIGTSKGLKDDLKLSTKCYAVEPKDLEILAGGSAHKAQHLLQGTSYGIIPPLYDSSYVDGFLNVTDEEAIFTQKELAKKEGLYVGYSAAANICASLKLAHSGQMPKEANIITIACDTGLKYSF
jgi:cysteine synthase